MAKLKREVRLANKAYVVASPGGVVSACAYTTRAGAERALDSGSCVAINGGRTAVGCTDA
jgi:hypothetical protein